MFGVVVCKDVTPFDEKHIWFHTDKYGPMCHPLERTGVSQLCVCDMLFCCWEEVVCGCQHIGVQLPPLSVASWVGTSCSATPIETLPSPRLKFSTSSVWCRVAVWKPVVVALPHGLGTTYIVLLSEVWTIIPHECSMLGGVSATELMSLHPELCTDPECSIQHT